VAEKPQAPRGTFDVLPEEGARRERLIAQVAAPLMAENGFGEIATPVFEDTALFARGVGESTDVVQKEMYSFEDQGGRSLTLRPEGTASVCRAYVEHGMHKLPQPVKLWYHGPFFRQEAPQAGRFRQFSQIGAETLGADSPLVDAESIALLNLLLVGAGVKGLKLRIGSLGSPDERRAYSHTLRAFLRANESQLAKEVVERIDLNPLRAFDAKDPGTRAVMMRAPLLMDVISRDGRERFNEVLRLLTAAGVSFDVDPMLVRGLDYYTDTVFEFTAEGLGAQAAVAGGGRYDGLIETLGGPPTPGFGWAAGIERMLASAEQAESEPKAAAFIALDAGADAAAALHLAVQLRARLRAPVEVELAERALRSQLKQAARIGARNVVIFGGGRGQYDAAVKNMETGTQQELSDLEAATFVAAIAEQLER
jgi:histidyl-tRNA synthetase